MVQVDTWVAGAGKNGMRRDWHVRDYNSGHTILRATRYEFHLYLYLFHFIL
jgi:fatty acyl-ACP thioesterase B